MQLVNYVQELEEDGREPGVLVGVVQVAPVVEPVTQRQPLLLHQNPEPLKEKVNSSGSSNYLG